MSKTAAVPTGTCLAATPAMLRASFLPIALVTVLPACADEPRYVSQPTRYSRPAGGFPDFESCEETREPGSLFNCAHTVDLCPDGRAQLVFTDIINPAAYELFDRRIDVWLVGAGDVPEEMTFAIQADGSLVSTEVGERPFTRESPPRYAIYACE